MKCDNCGKGFQFGKRADGLPNGIEFELENGERAVYCIECLEKMREKEHERQQ